MANAWPPLAEPEAAPTSVATLEQWLALPEDAAGEWVDGRLEDEEAGHYQKLAGVISGCIDPVPGCPGLRLDVDGLWAELARLGDEPV